VSNYEEFLAEAPAAGLMIARQCVELSAADLSPNEIIQRMMEFGCGLRDRLIAAGSTRAEALAVVNAVFLAAEREMADLELCLVSAPGALQ